jgi:hypothetical protein
MPKKKVFIRYIGEERTDDDLLPGYRYEVSRAEEAGLMEAHGEEVIRLEPSLEELPLLEDEDEAEEKPKPKTTRRKTKKAEE